MTDPSGLDGCFDPVAGNGGGGCVGGGDSLGGGGGGNLGDGEGAGGGEGNNVSGGIGEPPTGPGPEAGEGKVACPENTAEVVDPADKWATRGTFWQHYYGHAEALGFETPEAYVEGAENFLEEAKQQELPMKEQANGNIVVANFDTGEFAIYNYDGKPVTYYLLDPSLDIEKYFEDQPGTLIP